MDELISILNEIGLPYAYDHFAEGESPNPPFICYLLPGSDNFAADGRVYYKINDVHIELYTDYKNTELDLTGTISFTTNPRYGSTVKSSTR